ncbi:WD repeat-containing protein 75-like [Daphnia pulicaria]|uniref:WD repeat-containing protein 75-like n=1 Tax=Daphnia pulicaria TaxID=35523 RepID=UPI001EEAEE31|nr:WD repeat-containing protein 75-like [Daphnia pulicaria]
MANKKTRGPDKAKTNTDNIVVKRQEDAPDIVKQPPVFTDDSRYLCIASGRQVGIYSIQSGDKVHCLKKHSFDIIGLGIKEENILYLCDTSGDVIEWDIKDGKLLKKTSVAVDGMKKFCSFYYPGNGMFLLSTPAKNTNGSSLWIVNSTSEREIFSEDIRKEPQSVAFGCDQGNGSLVIGALNYQCNGVLVKDMNSGAEKKHMTDKRKFTCIALHKEKLIMATGDISGRILIWHDFVNQIRPVKTVYHWHTLAVSSGEYLYSGGSEKVMVKWRLEAIRIIDSTNKINRAIFGGLVKHDPIRGLEDGESKKESVMPTGLVFDPRTQGIFFNSQAGFLQLFDPLRSSMIFNMDIANRNVLTDERNTIIGNAEVLRVAVSPTGYHDMNLKFWRYDAVQANYELNTDVTMPHHDRITSLAFQPGLLGTEYPCLWTCDVAGDFRKMMPTAASFSEDGSLLAIAFQDTVTSWDPMTINLNTTLSHNLIEGRS